jgi:hypothetical protein
MKRNIVEKASPRQINGLETILLCPYYVIMAEWVRGVKETGDISLKRASDASKLYDCLV